MCLAAAGSISMFSRIITEPPTVSHAMPYIYGLSYVRITLIKESGMTPPQSGRSGLAQHYITRCGGVLPSFPHRRGEVYILWSPLVPVLQKLIVSITRCQFIHPANSEHCLGTTPDGAHHVHDYAVDITS